MLVRGIRDPADVRDAFRAWNLDGAIFVGFTDAELQAIGDVPAKAFVAVESYTERPGVMTVHSDDREGGRLGAQHLIDKGHRRIAFAGDMDSDYRVYSERYAGYLSALAASGIESDASLVFAVGQDYSAGFGLGRTLHSAFPDITAVVATADALAIGILNGLTSVGARVPEDVSLVGFDNRDISTFTNPQLTTVAQDVAAKAAAAVEMVINGLEGEQLASNASTMPVTLIERGSVAQVKARP